MPEIVLGEHRKHKAHVLEQIQGEHGKMCALLTCKWARKVRHLLTEGLTDYGVRHLF